MITLPIDRTPSQRSAALAGVLGKVSTLDLYEIVATALNVLDEREDETVVPTPQGLAGCTAEIVLGEGDNRWHPVLHAEGDPDEGNTEPGLITVEDGAVRGHVRVNLLREQVAR